MDRTAFFRSHGGPGRRVVVVRTGRARHDCHGGYRDRRVDYRALPLEKRVKYFYGHLSARRSLGWVVPDCSG